MLKLQQQIASGIYGINRVGNMAIALFSIRRSNFHFLSLPNPYLFFSQPQRGQAAAASLPLASPSRRLSAVNFPEDLIPEIFRCALLFKIMDNPVRLPDTHQVCERAAVLEALQQELLDPDDRPLINPYTGRPEIKSFNPFNRQPMKIEDAKPEPELRRNIAFYVDQIIEGIHHRQKELGPRRLTHADYEDIHQKVMSVLEFAASPIPRPH